MIEGLDEWEAQEAAKRAAGWDATATARTAKIAAERAKIAAGIGVETPEDTARYADADIPED